MSSGLGVFTSLAYDPFAAVRKFIISARVRVRVRSRQRVCVCDHGQRNADQANLNRV